MWEITSLDCPKIMKVAPTPIPFSYATNKCNDHLAKLFYILYTKLQDDLQESKYKINVMII